MTLCPMTNKPYDSVVTPRQTLLAFVYGTSLFASILFPPCLECLLLYFITVFPTLHFVASKSSAGWWS